MSAIGSGVVSGLLSSFFVLAFITLWNRMIEPWFENRVYKDIRIAGKWRTAGLEEGIPFEEVVTVYQQAHRVWGLTDYTSQGVGGERYIEHYEFAGECRNQILTAAHWSSGEVDRGAFTLMLRNNGQVLKGHYASYYDDKNDVISGAYEWIRMK